MIRPQVHASKDDEASPEHEGFKKALALADGCAAAARCQNTEAMEIPSAVFGKYAVARVTFRFDQTGVPGDGTDKRNDKGE